MSVFSWLAVAVLLFFVGMNLLGHGHVVLGAGLVFLSLGAVVLAERKLSRQ